MKKHPVVVVANPSLSHECGMPSLDIMSMEVKPHCAHKPIANMASQLTRLVHLKSTGLNNYYTGIQMPNKLRENLNKKEPLFEKKCESTSKSKSLCCKRRFGAESSDSSDDEE